MANVDEIDANPDNNDYRGPDSRGDQVDTRLAGYVYKEIHNKGMSLIKVTNRRINLTVTYNSTVEN